MNDTCHLCVTDLTVRYGETTVLSNINVAIPDRKITAIIGPSGSGKTTLLKSFNRLLDLDTNVTVTGEVNVDGENIYAPGVEVTHIRKKMGLLAQRPTVLPMSIYDNVAFGPRLNGTRNKRRLDELVRLHLVEAAALPGARPGGGTGSDPRRRAHVGPRSALLAHH
jgi:phosphate transport system ATP-binding protein